MAPTWISCRTLRRWFVAQLVVDTGQPTAPLRDLEHLLRLPGP